MKTARAEASQKQGARIIAEIVQALIKNPTRTSTRPTLVHNQIKETQIGANIFSKPTRSPRHA
jgi:hypothetical protein